jgi:hypothetical protein
MGRDAALGVIGLVALAAVGFVAGRAVPADPPPSSSGESPELARASTIAAPPRGRRPPTPERRPAEWIEGRRVLPSFRAALDADQTAALRTRSAVIVALEARRRAHDDALRACFDSAGIDDPIAIAFDVDVRSRGDALEIADVTFGDVVEGPPLEPSVAACLEPLLTGATTVPAGTGGEFLVGYDGPIDYVARFSFAPERVD